MHTIRCAATVLLLAATACGDDTGPGGSGGSGGSGGGEGGTGLVGAGQPDGGGGTTTDGGGGEGGTGGDTPSACDSTTALAAPDSVSGTLDGATHTEDGSCASGDGVETVYVVTADEIGGLLFDLSSEEDLAISVRTDCDDPQTEIACANTGAAGEDETLTIATNGDETFYVIVEGNGAADDGAFILNVSEQSSPSCSAAQVLADPGTATGNTFGQPEELQSSCQPGSAFSGEDVYVVTVAETGVLALTLTSTADLGLSVRTVCTDLGSEIGCRDAFPGGIDTVETLTFPAFAGETLYVIVDAFDADTGGAYTLDIESHATVCGDDVVEGSEQCDDGNTTAGDGCSATCTVEACDTPIVLAVPSTTTDDTDDGVDFTSTFCDGPVGTAPELAYRFTAPSDGTITIELDSPTADLGFEVRLVCGDPNSALGCVDQVGPGVETAFANVVQGEVYDLIVTGFNGDSGPFTLDMSITAAGCGNGVLEAAEQCDDGNTTSGDGCSATCTAEQADCANPLDLTLPATATGTTGGQDNVIEVECGLFGYPEIVYQVTPSLTGVLDVTFLSDGPSILSVETTCGDEDTSVSCGVAGPQVIPVTINVPVFFVVNGPENVSFTLDIDERVPGCGDGFLDPGEECDDGNTTAGDGCSANCDSEGCIAPTVIAPTSTTNGTNVGAADQTSTACDGFNGTSGDVFYSVTAPADGVLSLTLDSTADLGFEVRAVCADPLSGILCRDAALGGATETGSVGLSSGETVTIVVTGFNGASSAFVLGLSFQASICGDDILTPPEECDDGGTANGDGCSSTCTFEVTETEPNNSFGTADAFTSPFSGTIAPAGDEDWISIVVPGPASTLTATIVDGGTLCAPPAPGIDSDIALFAPNGTTELAFNDDISVATDWCSAATTTGLAAGTYFIRVRSSQQFAADGTFAYGLTVTVN